MTTRSLHRDYADTVGSFCAALPRGLEVSTREVDGPGHNSILEKDGQLWIFYHGRDRDVHSPQEDCRCMRADRLMVSGDRLWVDVRDDLA